MSVIELGELTRDDDRPPPPVPVRLDRRLVRQVALAVLAVLTVLGVTGSTGSVRHNIRPLWGTAYEEGDSMALDDTTLYAGQRIDGLAFLTAYDLATGRKRWAVPSDDGDTSIPLRPVVNGVLVMPKTTVDDSIPQDDGSFVIQTYTSSTIARDASTGRTLWTLPGDALGTYADSVLLGVTDGYGSLKRLSVAGLRDGVTRWTTELHDIDVWTIADAGGTPRQILLGDPTGLITVLDYADGSTVHSGRVSGHGRRVSGTAVYAGMQVLGDQLVVSRSDNEDIASTVYRLDDFQELWQFDGFVVGCGVVLCSMEEGGLSGRDPATGHVLWSRTDLNGVWPLPAGGRFLANGPSSLGPYQMVDSATGHGVGEAVRGEPTWTGSTLSGSVLLIGVVAENYHLSSVIRLDLDTGRSYLLGAITETVHFGCQSTPGYLVCARPDGLDVISVG
jgi:hypothetical protein